MSCCQPTRAEFLATKLTNFRLFLESACETEDEKAKLIMFSSTDSAMPYLLHALSLRQSGTLDASIETMCKNLMKKEVPGFREKLGRYINMFCDVISS